MKKLLTVTALSILLPAIAHSTPWNLSTRGYIADGRVMHGGALINGGEEFIVRATTTTVGLPESIALPDPKVTVFKLSRSAPGEIVASNDNWKDDFESDLVKSFGLAPKNDNEAALYFQVPEGNEAYTFIVEGSDPSQSGEALIELFRVQKFPPQLGQAAQQARDALQQLTNISEIKTVYVENVTWKNGFLGCDEEEVNQQDQQQGQLVVFYPRDASRTYTYHTSDDANDFILCQLN